MVNLDKFRDSKIAKNLLKKIDSLVTSPLSFMEVCGTHTVAISQFGIRNALPSNLKFLSGPGCPVCVTPISEIDHIIELGGKKDIVITTFGDMMRVPGSHSTLEKERAKGRDIRVVYSSMDALNIAEIEGDKKIVFVGVGFETTSPTVAVTIRKAKEKGVHNFYVFSRFKLIPPAIKGVLEMGKNRIDGFLLPGHVSTIIGSHRYEFIPKGYQIPCVIGGFEPLDILHSIVLLLEQVKKSRPKVDIQYRRSVKEEGNLEAIKILEEVFEVKDTDWRGIGRIKKSGLELKARYNFCDVDKVFKVKIKQSREPKGCICGEILMGNKLPQDCVLFGKKCTPHSPVGPCMVSSEGACSAYYKYDVPRTNTEHHF